jgi:NADPH2:quinone reductase
MKAVRFHELGGPEVLRYEEVPEPQVSDTSILIKVAAAGVNYADLGWRRGTYPRHDPLPATLGSEVAGTIVRVGLAVQGFSPGKRVMAWVGHGGYAEYVTAPEIAVYAIPDHVGFQEAAGIPIAFLTAYHILKTSGRVQTGDTVLVQAAASGVGTAAVQLAKRWGARVIATASTEEKLRLAYELGADVLINYHTTDFVSEVRCATNQRGVDIVLECVGGEVLTKSLDCLAPMGRLVIYGRASGSLPFIDPAQILTRNIAVIGLHLGMPPWRVDMQRQPMRELLGMVEAGTVRPIIDRSFPLKDAAAAHQYLADRRTMGKVVLVP